MRLIFSLSLLVTAHAFSITGQWDRATQLSAATLKAPTKTTTPSVEETPIVTEEPPSDYMGRLEAQLQKMKIKDATSKNLKKEDLKVVYEDDHIVVIDKPSGVLCVPNSEGHPSLQQSVFEAFGNESGQADRMVVHRLGFDTSGLVVFVKTEDALRGMNTVFRNRMVSRKYEALLCGHLEAEDGTIDLPLMRDYQYPPFMRVSTDEKQRELVGLTVEDVGRRVLEGPKDSLTTFEVVEKEQFSGNPVTRVTLTSVSGRTHQLNVHCAALGHPIVGDRVYGINGDAAANGGLSEGTVESRASTELQESIFNIADDMCVHAKHLGFRHPVTGEDLVFESEAPF